MLSSKFAQVLIWCLAAYVAGSVNFSILVSQAVGKGDIRRYYSKNPGVTNVYRLLGWPWAFLVLVLDVGRGASLAILAANQLESSWMFMAACICLLVGNLIPLFHGFAGGKGVATSLGVLLGVNPGLGSISPVVWILVVLVTGKASLGSLAAVGVFPVLAAVLAAPIYQIVLGALLLLVIVITHRKNIGRILKGKEPSIIKKSTTTPHLRR